MHFSKNTKIILLILVLVAIVAMIIISVQENLSTSKELKEITLNPTSIPADWKTCRNVEAGYEIKYPKEWYIYGEGSSHSPSVLDRTTECIGRSVFLTTQPPSNIRGYQSGDLSLSVTIDTEEYVRSRSGIKELSPKTDLDLLKAWRGGENVIGYYIIDDNQFVLFRFPKSGSLRLIGIYNHVVYEMLLSEELQDATILGDIISTFRFLN